MESPTPFRPTFLAIIVLLLLGSCTDERSEEEMLESAKSYLSRQDHRSASIELKNTLKTNINNAEARFLLGKINYRDNNLAGAEKEFKRALQAGWDVPQTKLALARTLLANNEYEKLLDEIQVDATWPASYQADILALRSLAHEALDDTDKATSTLRKSLGLDGDSLFTLMALSRLQMSGAFEGSAAETINTALAIYPENLELLILHATNQVLNSNNEAAIEILKKVIDSDDPGKISRQSRIARIELALIYMSIDKYQQAEKILDYLLKKDHRDPIPNYLNSLIAFSQTDYRKAELHMRNLLKLAPGHNQSQHLMGNIKYALQDFGQAANHFTASLNEAPDKLTVYKLLTRTYIELNNYDLANTTIKSALSIAPDDAESISLLSQLRFLMGNTDDGIDTVYSALQKDPENLLLIKQLANLYIESGEVAEAHPYIKKYERLSSDKDEVIYLKIRSYMITGDSASAITLAEKHLAENPDNPDNHSLVGNIYASDKNFDTARSYFDNALKIESENPSALLGLAQIEDELENFEEAISLYRRYAISDLTDITPIIALSEIARKQSKIDDMLYWLKDARDRFQGDLTSRRNLARYYLNSSQPGNATKYVIEALSISPDDTSSLFIYSKILASQGRLHEATAQLKKSLSITPDDIDARILLGQLYLELDLIDAARKQLLIALGSEDSNILVLSLLAETELKALNYNKCLEYVAKLQMLYPEYHISYTLEGNVWIAEQNYEKARVAFEKSWSIEPSAESAKKLYAIIIQYDSLDEATKPLLDWLDEHPGDMSSWFYLAYAYQSSGQNNQAIRVYENLLSASPDNSTILNNLAWLHPLDSQEALDYAEKAYRSSPSDPGILDTYGWILTKHGHFARGHNHLRAALKKLPDNDEVNYHYGANLILSGETDAGAVFIDRAVKSNRAFSGREDAIKLLDEYSNDT